MITRVVVEEREQPHKQYAAHLAGSEVVSLVIKGVSRLAPVCCESLGHQNNQNIPVAAAIMQAVALASLLCLLSRPIEAAQLAAPAMSISAHCCSAELLAPEESACLQRLRGGAGGEDNFGLDSDLDEDLDEEGAGSSSEVRAAGLVAGDALDNPFLGGDGAARLGLDNLSSTLNDPKMLQDALKELQNPTTQARVRAMMEDPEFQKSMQQYMEQMTKDPQFDALKKQTEVMLQEQARRPPRSAHPRSHASHSPIPVRRHDPAPMPPRAERGPVHSAGVCRADVKGVCRHGR